MNVSLEQQFAAIITRYSRSLVDTDGVPSPQLLRELAAAATNFHNSSPVTSGYAVPARRRKNSEINLRDRDIISTGRAEFR